MVVEIPGCSAGSVLPFLSCDWHMHILGVVSQLFVVTVHHSRGEHYTSMLDECFN